VVGTRGRTPVRVGVFVDVCAWALRTRARSNLSRDLGRPGSQSARVRIRLCSSGDTCGVRGFSSSFFCHGHASGSALFFALLLPGSTGLNCRVQSAVCTPSRDCVPFAARGRVAVIVYGFHRERGYSIFTCYRYESKTICISCNQRYSTQSAQRPACVLYQNHTTHNTHTNTAS
jgi:hypothetical protein